MASEIEATSPAHSAALRQAELRDELLRPLPRVTLKMVVAVIVIIAVYAWSIEGTNVSPTEFMAGIPNIADFIVRLFPPRFDLETTAWAAPAFLQGWLGAELPIAYPGIVPYIIETVQMAVIGTSGAIILSIPFALLAARNTAPYPWIYQITRMLLNINRAIPDIIFALIFVAAVGLGPFGGVMALAIGSIGSLAKLYAEAIEAIDPQQVLAVRATGSSRMQAFVYGVVPQALPLAASYSLLYFEHNVRSATILGLVGAGGVGFIITKYINLFQYRDLMGALILIVITVTIIDRISDFLRKRLI